MRSILDHVSLNRRGRGLRPHETGTTSTPSSTAA